MTSQEAVLLQEDGLIGDHYASRIPLEDAVDDPHGLLRAIALRAGIGGSGALGRAATDQIAARVLSRNTPPRTVRSRTPVSAMTPVSSRSKVEARIAQPRAAALTRIPPWSRR